MRIAITIDDIIVELDDETSNPTLDGIESILRRMSDTAVAIYEKTFKESSEVFNIDFHPLPDVQEDEDSADE
jgi:hypothetical protein